MTDDQAQAKIPVRCTRLIYTFENRDATPIPHWCERPGNHPGPHRTQITEEVEFGP